MYTGDGHQLTALILTAPWAPGATTSSRRSSGRLNPEQIPREGQYSRGHRWSGARFRIVKREHFIGRNFSKMWRFIARCDWYRSCTCVWSTARDFNVPSCAEAGIIFWSDLSILAQQCDALIATGTGKQSGLVNARDFGAKQTKHFRICSEKSYGENTT